MNSCCRQKTSSELSGYPFRKFILCDVGDQLQSSRVCLVQLLVGSHCVQRCYLNPSTAVRPL